MTYNIYINQALEISSIDQGIGEDDLVYLHNNSINVVPHEVGLCEIQASLTERLSERLNHSGRKSLAERTIKKQFITYKELKSLAHQINKPRTRETLQANRYLQWSIDHNNFPDFAKEDMIKNNIQALPSNIYDLSKTVFCNESGSYSLVLFKYIITQGMEIDYDTPFDDLKEEFKDCLKLIFRNTLSIGIKELLATAKCIASLEYFHTMWKQQGSHDWNKITRQPTVQRYVESSSEQFISDSQHEGQLPNIATNLLRQETETSNREVIATPFEARIEPSLESTVAEAIAKKITELNLSILNNKQDEDTSKPMPKSKKKTTNYSRHGTGTPLTKHPTCSTQDSLTLSQTSLAPSQETITQKTTSKPEYNPDQTSLALPQRAMSEARSPLPENNYSLACQGARPKKTKSHTDQTLLTFQKTIYDLKEFKTLKNTIIKNDSDFRILTKSCFQKILIRTEKKEATVFNYIKNPHDEIKLNKAKKVLNKGPWISERYLDLLEKAYEANKHEFFLTRLNLFIKNNHFKDGYPPRDPKTGKLHMESRGLTGNGQNFYYILAKNVTPVEAINSCFYNLWLTNQEIIVELSLLVALLIYWDNKLFNHFFINDNPVTERLSMISYMRDSTIKSRCRILKFFAFFIPVRRLTKGSFYFFNNHPLYYTRHPFGEYQCLIALCTVNDLTDPHFITSCSFKEVTPQSIFNKLIDKYNKKPCDETIISSSLWDNLKNNYQYSSSPETSKAPPSITKEILLSTKKGGRMNHDFLMEFEYENAQKILKSHMKFENHAKHKEFENLERLQKQESTHKTHKTHNWPEFISDKSDVTSEKTTTKKQSEPDPMEMFDKYISIVNTEARRYKKKNTLINAEKAKKAFYDLEVFHNKLKTENITINDKHQTHFDDIAKRIGSIP